MSTFDAVVTPLPPQVGFPPLEPDIFGPIVGADDVRDAVRNTIRRWSPTYIAAMAARSDKPLVPFDHWDTLYEYRALPSDQGPACWVTCSGVVGDPLRQGSGVTSAVFEADVHIVINGLDWQETSDLTSAYTKTVRALLLQQGGLDGFVGVDGGTKWVAEKYQEIAHEARRSLGVGVSRFHITVDGVVNTSAGPKAAPVPAFTPGGPIVDEVVVGITKLPLYGD